MKNNPRALVVVYVDEISWYARKGSGVGFLWLDLALFMLFTFFNPGFGKFDALI